MPSLPSAPPAPHALLASPLLGLGILLAVTVLVSLLCVAASRVRSKIAERRIHRADVEAGATSAVSVVHNEGNNSPTTPSSVLLAARIELKSLERQINMRKTVVEMHKQLMAETNNQTAKPVVTGKIPATQRFVQRHGHQQQYLSGRFGTARKQWEAPGPSSLRIVLYTPEEPVVDTVSEAEAAPKPAPIEDSIPSLDNVAITIVTSAKTCSPKRSRALLLAALANGYDSNSDSDFEYDISVASEISLTFALDAIRGVWTTAPVTSGPSTDAVMTTPTPISVVASASTGIISVVEQSAAAAAPIPARPLVNSRLRNLRLAAKAGTTKTTSPKRRSRRNSIEDKENSSSVAGQSNLQNTETARHPIHA
ncbi:hypothetical protein B0H16DRAFT_1881937 [Mycena metata]|uniref:Uncharacterized protein n=1 Tax=Mycena metata TaxID=1033252 RepID=A0AAD7NPT6_9AGAR|nr:hypothetical protein B0H16DRAFT_1881937 [Mycena metata]